MSETVWSWLIVGLVLPLSLAMTRLMIGIAPKLGLVDQPDARRIHQKPIPRAGGLGLFVTLIAGLICLRAFGTGFEGMLGGRWTLHFVAASGLLVIAGFFDDRGGISAWLKLGVQILAAVLMFFHNPGGAGIFMGWKIPWFLDLAIHVAWTVALINAFNLIDGMDGLCSGLATISLVILTALAVAGDRPTNAFVIALMAAALLGFLRYNFHPARIFLGDTGSMLIGFFIASVGTATVGRHAVVAGLLLPLLVGGVPLLDVTLAIWRRAARRIAVSKPGQATIHIFGADRDHLHHRLLNWGLNQRQAVFVIYGFAGLCSFLALLPILGGASYFTVSVVGIIVIGLVGLRYIAPVEFMESGRGLRTLIRRPRGCRETMLIYFVYDLAVLFGSALLAWWILDKVMIRPFSWEAARQPATLFAACTVVGLCFARAHSRRWTRASTHDFAECLLWLACGAGISFALVGMSQDDFNFHDAAVHLAALSLGCAGVLAPRCIGFLLQESVIDTMHRKRRMRSKRSSRTALIYGAGDLGELFVCNLRLSQPETWLDYHFIGFIDDSPKLRGRRMRGFPILGTSAQIPELVKRTGANCILVTSSVLSPGRLDELMEIAESHDLEVHHWQPDMMPELIRAADRPAAEAIRETTRRPSSEIPRPEETTALRPA
ncbi:MraY family glycosyltransferase [Luteolibacter marinus]|uniref:MraY family glycosyltransferase n=1 Tax=Luteolibacter marinus TaxID=2776705 RepID=UPI0018696A9C|nr:MraY family glycosyltransferase [Luteolibacter marinus]